MKNFLAIDTASHTLRIMVSANGASRFFHSQDMRTASVVLMPEIDRLLGELNVSLSDIDKYICVNGPGSFTGIRIGLATIKTFSYVLKKDIVSVSSLKLMAYAKSCCGKNLITVCDAGNGYRYVAVYDKDCNIVSGEECIETDYLQYYVSKHTDSIVVCDEVCCDEVQGSQVCLDSEIELAWNLVAEIEKTINYNELEPIYIRKPQAEIDLEKKNGKTS